MNIELSPKEYRDLLDLLHIADVVMTGHRRAEDKRTTGHRALVQKLYSLAQHEGFERLMSHDERVHKYVPTAEFEQSSLAHPLLDAFGEHLFWDELISRLSARDTAQMAGGTEQLNALDDRERQRMEGPIRQRYIEEFSANGVANLEVVERFSSLGTAVRTSD